MLVTTALLMSLAAPAQTAPDDDPVRVALYGRPVEVAIAEVSAAPSGHVGRAVRVRGRLQAAASGGFRMCEGGHCLRLVPEEGLSVVLQARAAEWMGQDLEVTGVIFRDRQAPAADADAAFAIRFWRVRTPRAGDAPALPGTPLTLEALLYAGGAFDGRLVRVQGRFRGRNLHVDLPPSSQRGRGDWVIKDDYYAVWVTGRDPQGAGWKLDPSSLSDTAQWVEVSGRPQTRGGFVYLKAEAVAPLAPPVAAEAVAPPPALAGARMTPPVLVFALPLEGEDLAPEGARLLLQFSKHMDPTSLSPRVRLRYAGEQATFAPARVTYDAARRTLLVEPGTLAAGREVECLLVAGMIDVHGQALVPRQGAIVAGVVDVLRYRVSAVGSSPSGG